jgi:hypothetical protein
MLNRKTTKGDGFVFKELCEDIIHGTAQPAA